ncbi:MAG: fibronectin type III domain-containing protein, partial [Thermoplasmata archaeon]
EFLVSYDNVTIRALSETIRDRNATAYVYRDLLPATHYHIRIRTVCDNSSESLSEVYEVMTPPTPVTLHATMSEQALTLTWSTNTDQNFSRYDVYVSFLEGQLGTLVASVDNRFANSMILTNLTRGPDYFLTVAVISSHGKVSYSDQAVVPFETQTDYSLLVIITVSMIVIALLFAAIRYGQTRRVRP